MLQFIISDFSFLLSAFRFPFSDFSFFVPIALAVVTKSATDSVDSNRYYLISDLYSINLFSVNSVNSV